EPAEKVVHAKPEERSASEKLVEAQMLNLEREEARTNERLAETESEELEEMRKSGEKEPPKPEAPKPPVA
ncbi:MAG TPA: hypothetical protein VJG48_03170, partial [Candidatus Paceibacterota bacterium]